MNRLSSYDITVYESDEAVRLLCSVQNVVVKYFKDTSNNVVSVKFWFGSNPEKVASFWKTKLVDRKATDEEVDLFIEEIGRAHV